MVNIKYEAFNAGEEWHQAREGVTGGRNAMNQSKETLSFSSDSLAEIEGIWE